MQGQARQVMLTNSCLDTLQNPDLVVKSRGPAPDPSSCPVPWTGQPGTLPRAERTPRAVAVSGEYGGTGEASHSLPSSPSPNSELPLSGRSSEFDGPGPFGGSLGAGDPFFVRLTPDSSAAALRRKSSPGYTSTAGTIRALSAVLQRQLNRDWMRLPTT